MTETEFFEALHLPSEPCTSAEFLRRLNASGDWQVDRIMGSAGEFVVEVTYLPLHCQGHILCQPVAGGRYTIRGIGCDRVTTGAPCESSVGHNLAVLSTTR